MLTLAAMGYYDPKWSDAIVAEMRRNVLGDHPTIASDHFDNTTIAALRRVFLQAWVDVPEELVAAMDTAPEDRHVLAAAIASGAHVVVTVDVADFDASHHVTSGQVAIEPPALFLGTVLVDNPDVLTSVLWHLAHNRRGVTTIADVLDQLDRNETMRSFVADARTKLPVVADHQPHHVLAVIALLTLGRFVAT